MASIPGLSDPIAGSRLTITSVALHPENDNPLFGEGVTELRLEDEAGGPFLILTQHPDTGDSQSIRLDFDEIEPLVHAASLLRSQVAVAAAIAKSDTLLYKQPIPDPNS